MNIAINKTKYEIPVTSDLTCSQFNKIFIINKVTSLDHYLSLFTDIEQEKILESKISSYTVSALHAFIFDVDIEETIKNKKNTFKYEGDIYKAKDLELDTFGKEYYYDLYLQRCKAGKINEFQLSLYALAIAITPSLDDTIEKIYNKLLTYSWIKVAPVSFFLLKKYKNKKKHLTTELKTFTRVLKVVKLKMLASKVKLMQWVKI